MDDYEECWLIDRRLERASKKMMTRIASKVPNRDSFRL
jgi:hypothetical protein